MATAELCMLKRAMDHDSGVRTWFHIRVMDIPRTAFLSLLIPNRLSAWRTELMLPRRIKGGIHQMEQVSRDHRVFLNQVTQLDEGNIVFRERSQQVVQDCRERRQFI